MFEFIIDLKRWLFSRCSYCGKRFPWGYTPFAFNWPVDGPHWFRPEEDAYHKECALELVELMKEVSTVVILECER